MFRIDTATSFIRDLYDTSSPLFTKPYFTLVRAGDMMYFCKPGQHISLIGIQGISGNAISFTKEFLSLYGQASPGILDHQLFHKGLNFPGIRLAPEILQMIDSLCNNLVKEFAGGLELRHEMIGALLGILIVYCIRQIEVSGQLCFHSRSEELVGNFYRLLQENFKIYKLPGQYAALLCVSANHLNQLVKRLSGCNAGRHIQNRVVLEAKRMALQDGSTMKEIAYKLGFCDPAHFSKYFKKNTGKNSPTLENSGLITRGRLTKMRLEQS